MYECPRLFRIDSLYDRKAVATRCGGSPRSPPLRSHFRKRHTSLDRTWRFIISPTKDLSDTTLELSLRGRMLSTTGTELSSNGQDGNDLR